MIDLTKLTPLPEPTNVMPSDHIFHELGKNTYDYKDVISELIDNAIAAREERVLLKVDIYIYIDRNNNNKALDFIIKDNARGIPQDQLGLAITPAGTMSQNSLNEHGLGMKQAVSALGDLKYLATKIKSEKSARIIKEFRFGDLPTYECPFEYESGTEIAITNLKSIVMTNSISYTRTIVPYLGARYRRFLRTEAPQLELTVHILERTGSGDTEIYRIQVKELKPVYFHPYTRTNAPVILAYEIGGSRWSALLTMGYAPQEKAEYEELGLEAPGKFHPYNVSQSRQGLDIILHDRVILFHQLSEISIVSSRHNDWNCIRGEIDLKHGFTTAITKNSIIADENFRECIEITRQILSGELVGPHSEKKNYLKTKTYPEQIPEILMRDRLADWLKNNPLQPRKDVHTEYVVEGIEGFIDILADREAWEIKTEQACALDVFQLFMYMDVASIEKGFLVARSFTTGAEIAVKHILEKHSRLITLAEHAKFPITHPPTQSEREEYY